MEIDYRWALRKAYAFADRPHLHLFKIQRVSSHSTAHDLQTLSEEDLSIQKNLHLGNSIYDNFQPVNHEDKKSHPSGPGPGNRSYFGARTSQLYPLPFVGARLMGGYVRH